MSFVWLLYTFALGQTYHFRRVYMTSGRAPCPSPWLVAANTLGSMHMCTSLVGMSLTLMALALMLLTLGIVRQQTTRQV